MMGVERKSMIMSPEEKKATAWHEAGHTLVAVLMVGSDPIHKVSIIPRGRALGVTQYLPTGDKYTYSREDYKTRLATMMGGRVAEELALGQMTTGAGSDIEQASKLARNMVCRYGMSDVLGPLSFEKQDEQIFLGREIAQHRDYSEETARIIDSEVHNLVMGGYNKAKELIGRHMETLKSLTDVLMEKETIDSTEVIEICKSAILGEGLELPKSDASTSFVSRQEPTDKAKEKKAGGPNEAEPQDPNSPKGTVH
jgi:cell division protease FtsH